MMLIGINIFWVIHYMQNTCYIMLPKMDNYLTKLQLTDDQKPSSVSDLDADMNDVLASLLMRIS